MKQQQILQMAKDICRVKLNCNDVCNPISACDALKYAERAVEAGYCKIPDNIGDFSDGYHTFNELYHHRAVLFSVICNMFPEKAWKSKLHDTGDMFEGMFIVGIETEQGQATYHYDIEPYWDMFNVKELEKAPKWDGHTPSDAIGRIGNISVEGYRKQSEGEWIDLPDNGTGGFKMEKEYFQFTDEEIKTGLRCLSGEIILCKFCAFSHLEDRGFACKKNVSNAALALINRQKASLQEVITLNSKLEAENAKLQRLLDFYEETSGNKKARAEAIKEFAERLKSHLIIYTYINLNDAIDNLVKEMTEVNNG